MKIALLTDTHYGARKNSKLFHEFFQKFYDNIFFPTLKERGITECVHLGDAFDCRKSVDFWALQWAKENVYDKFRDLGIKLHQIVGNHDAYYKNTIDINAVDGLLESYDNVVRVSEPMECKIGGEKIVLVPWICEENAEQTWNLVKKTKAKVVMGHLELTGFEVIPGMRMEHGEDPAKFKKFERVFSGHYHHKSTRGNVTYLGNTYQMFWNDCNHIRGFHIYDTETHELEFIPNTYTIFEKIYYEDTPHQMFDTSEMEGKIVKVVVRKKSKQLAFEKFIDKIHKSGCSDLKVVENFEVDDEDVDLDGEKCEDTLTFLNKYIDDSDFDLEKDVVKRLMRDVYREACEMV